MPDLAHTPVSSSSSHRRTNLPALAVLLFLLLGIGGLFIWIRYDSGSEIAKNLRASIGGMDAPEVDPLPSPPPSSTPGFEFGLPEPEMSPPAQTIEPRAQLVEEAPRELNQITWESFTRTRRLWPARLDIVIDQAIPVRYREQNYGEMIFTPGQTLEVYEITTDGRVLGAINDNEVFIPAYATNLADWFVKTHGEFDELTMPEAVPPMVTGSADEAAADEDFFTQFRLWVYSNYDTPMIEITPETLVLRWTPTEEAEIDFRLEAREIARKYLLLGAEFGRIDNYANCEIRDRSTGELRGSNGIFIPKL